MPENGFFRTSDHAWVTLERIQFVGACNPPMDSGRHPLTLRFLRHVPVVYVDYPGHSSLIQIDGTFIRAMLRQAPSIRGLAEPLTNAMVDFYLQSQVRVVSEVSDLKYATLVTVSRCGMVWFSVEVVTCEMLFNNFLKRLKNVRLDVEHALPIIDYKASLSGEWVQWVSKVPQMEIETHRVAGADVVVPTVDTLRHEMLLNTWLSEHKPLVLCGPPGFGKRMTLLSVLRSLQAISQSALYGVLEPNTRKWMDGFFTQTIRKIIDNVRGETSKRQWVIFDGDVAPEWVENLNSVLNDNKLLTLPNGERLGMLPNPLRTNVPISLSVPETTACVKRSEEPDIVCADDVTSDDNGVSISATTFEFHSSSVSLAPRYLSIICDALPFDNKFIYKVSQVPLLALFVTSPRRGFYKHILRIFTTRGQGDASFLVSVPHPPEERLLDMFEPWNGKKGYCKVRKYYFDDKAKRSSSPTEIALKKRYFVHGKVTPPGSLRKCVWSLETYGSTFGVILVSYAVSCTCRV